MRSIPDIILPAELEPLAQWDERYQQTQNVAQTWNQLPVHTALNTMAFAHHPSCRLSTQQWFSGRCILMRKSFHRHAIMI